VSCDAANKNLRYINKLLLPNGMKLVTDLRSLKDILSAFEVYVGRDDDFDDIDGEKWKDVGHSDLQTIIGDDDDSGHTSSNTQSQVVTYTREQMQDAYITYGRRMQKLIAKAQEKGKTQDVAKYQRLLKQAIDEYKKGKFIPPQYRKRMQSQDGSDHFDDNQVSGSPPGSLEEAIAQICQKPIGSGGKIVIDNVMIPEPFTQLYGNLSVTEDKQLSAQLYFELQDTFIDQRFGKNKLKTIYRTARDAMVDVHKGSHVVMGDTTTYFGVDQSNGTPSSVFSYNSHIPAFIFSYGTGGAETRNVETIQHIYNSFLTQILVAENVVNAFHPKPEGLKLSVPIYFDEWFGE
jgi:hypothetical protein